MAETLLRKAYVERAFLIGISVICSLRLSRILNDVGRFDFLNEHEFTQFYGLTGNDINMLTTKFSYLPQINEIKNFYNGYTSNNLNIYNVWSIVNYLETGNLKSYWYRTGSICYSSILFTIDKLKLDVTNLLRGETITFIKNENIQYEDLLKLVSLCKSPERNMKDYNIFLSFLLEQGYLNIIGRESHYVTVKIPNSEIKLEFEILNKQYFLTNGM